MSNDKELIITTATVIECYEKTALRADWIEGSKNNYDTTVRLGYLSIIFHYISTHEPNYVLLRVNSNKTHRAHRLCERTNTFEYIKYILILYYKTVLSRLREGFCYCALIVWCSPSKLLRLVYNNICNNRLTKYVRFPKRVHNISRVMYKMYTYMAANNVNRYLAVPTADVWVR